MSPANRTQLPIADCPAGVATSGQTARLGDANPPHAPPAPLSSQLTRLSLHISMRKDVKSCVRIIEAFVVLKEATSNRRTYLTSSPRECAFYFFTDVISSERQSHPNIAATPSLAIFSPSFDLSLIPFPETHIASII